MKKIFFYTLIGIGLVYSPNVSGQVFDKNELEVKIDALIPPQINDSTPGVVIGVVQNGELIFSKGYGLANLSYGIPNDSKMVYNIGSVTKQFLGYAFAMLHVNGVLNLNDPVNKYLEDWPEFKHTVTLRHLLSHTSGYREAYTMSNLAGRIIGVDRLSRKECLEVVRKQPQLEFIPGSRFSYNSTAWVILAKVLEKATGMPADQWVKKNILQALEMNDTQIESYVGEVMHNASESYSYDSEQGYTNQESNRAIFGAAEIYTSIQDLVKWINNYRTAEIGGKEVNELFLEPFILSDGSNSKYALGIGNNSYRGLKVYRHTGGHEAFQTDLSYFPEVDMGIITISNYGDKGRLSTTKIADLLLENRMEPDVDKENHRIEIKKEKLEQFAGLYLAASLNNTMNLTMDKDSLTIDGRTKLIPSSHNTSLIKDWDGKIQIESLSKDKTQLIVLDGSKKRYSKVEYWVPNTGELANYEGDYWSEELETVYHLIIKDEKLFLQHRWIGEASLEAISKDFFKSEWGFFVKFIKFIRNTEGEISGLSISSSRTLNVQFKRKE